MSKVSIVTPCYNGENSLHNYMLSLVQQDYHNVELIFINDGSTDNTKQVFDNYVPKLEAKGWTVIYIEQVNLGQAAAINKGLQIFTGDYLVWFDSDDIIYSNHLSKKVELMEQNKDCGIGFSAVDVTSEKNIEAVTSSWHREPMDKEELFNSLLSSDNVSYISLTAIVRREAFLSVYPTRKIYEGTAGQNIQMILPLSYKYKACFIEDKLAKYIVYSSSHSHNIIDMESHYKRISDIYINTISNMVDISDEEKKQYIKQSLINQSRIFDCGIDTEVEQYSPFGITIGTQQVKNSIVYIKLLGIFPLFKIQKRRVYLFNYIRVAKIKESIWNKFLKI